MTEFELIGLGVVMGAIGITILISIGEWTLIKYGMDKAEYNLNTDCSGDSSEHNRERDGMDRYIPDDEEIRLVMQNFRRFASPYEKKIIDYITDERS